MRRTPRPVDEHTRAAVRGFEAMLQRGKGAFSERAFEAAARHRVLPAAADTVRWLERHGAPPVRLVESPAFPLVDDPFAEVLTPQRAMVEHLHRQFAEGNLVQIVDDPVRGATPPNPDMVERAQRWYADQVLMRQPGRLTGRYPQEGP